MRKGKKVWYYDHFRLRTGEVVKQHNGVPIFDILLKGEDKPAALIGSFLYKMPEDKESLLWQMESDIDFVTAQINKLREG